MSKISFPVAAVRFLMYIFLLAVLVVSLLPLYFMVVTALKTNTEVASNAYSLPAMPRWSNFVEAWAVGRFSSYLLNTVLITGGSVTLVVVLSLITGFSLAKLKLPGKQAIFLYFLAGFTVPFFGYMVSLFYTLKNLGLLNSRLGVVLTLSAINLPFGIFLMRSFFLNIPNDLLDSARIDGGNTMDILIYIMVPLAKPAIFALVVMQCLWSWNDLIVPLIILHKDALRTISVGLTFFQTRFAQDYRLTAAGTTIAALPLIVVYIIFQRHFIRGMMQGAFK